MGQLVLPFKPFTFDEVQAVVRAETKVIDSLTLNVLKPKLGDDKMTIGLDWMQLFAVFVGARYLHEGAPLSRAQAVVTYLGGCLLLNLEAEIAAGRSFPAPRGTTGVQGCMVEPPPGALGRRLDLKVLLPEFRAAFRHDPEQWVDGVPA